MAYDEGLAQRIREYIESRDRVSERKMFGGIVFSIGGNMCCGVVGDELMVRVGPEGYEDALAQTHAREMDFTGRPMRGMVYIATAGIAEDDDLVGWIDRGASFAAKLPAK